MRNNGINAGLERRRVAITVIKGTLSIFNNNVFVKTSIDAKWCLLAILHGVEFVLDTWLTATL